jgi:iron complex transport system ATP-binding protein
MSEWLAAKSELLAAKSELLAASVIHFSYGDRAVLRDIALSLAPGRIVALLGPNGSGKTTLIRALLGQVHARGTIQWDGKNLSQWNARELAKRVAYLPQSPTIDPEHRVMDVLRLGRAPYWQMFGIETTHDAEVVASVAAELGLSDMLSRRLETLSGGQRQRVFLGRCLVQEPAAMLLDEPNTFLDLKHQIELGALLRKLARERNIAILMASHDLNLAGMIADEIALLKDGRVLKHGSPNQVLEPAILQEVYGVAMQRIDRGGNFPPLVFPMS